MALRAVSPVMIILLLVAAGYFFGAKKWMVAEHKSFLEKFLVNLAIPCTCINGFIKNLTMDILRGSWKIILVSFLGIAICTVLSAAIAKLIRLPRLRTGVFIAMGGISNVIFVGFPVITELLGESNLVYAMLFLVANSPASFMLCYAILPWSSQGEFKFGLRQIRKVFLNPPLIGIAAGILLVVAGISLPSPISKTIEYLGGTVSPLALFYCGFIIYENGIKSIRFDRGMVAMLCIRFPLSIIVAYLLCYGLGVSAPASSVIVAEMAMPVMTTLVVLAKECDADAEYAARGVVLSTLACLVVIPVLAVIL